MSKPRFKTKTVRTTRQAERLIRDGWEVVSSTGRESWFWGSDLRIVLRKER